MGALAQCTKLHLAHNQIGDVGMEAFASACATGAMAQCAELSLTENKIREKFPLRASVHYIRDPLGGRNVGGDNAEGDDGESFSEELRLHQTLGRHVKEQ